MTAVCLFFKKNLTEEGDRLNRGFLVQLDGRSISLESGRYMETVGKNADSDSVLGSSY